MKKKIVSKILTGILTLSLTASLLIGCGTSAENSAGTQENTEVEEIEETEEITETVSSEETEADTVEGDTVVHIGTLASQIQPALASQLGYFEEEGVEVEIIAFDAGPAEVEAFTSGALDIVLIGDLPFLNGVNNGVDLQIVGFYQSSTKDCQLAVRDEANIQSFADLKGKKVAVPVGSNAQPILYEMLEAGGLAPEDVELFNLAAADGANALLTGDVDAAITWDPFLSNALVEGGITVFADTSEFRPLVCPIATSTAFVNEHHDEVEKALRALYRAGTWAKENVEDAAGLVADYFGAESSDSYVVSITNKDLNILLTDEKIEAIKEASEKCYQYEITEAEVDIDAHIIYDFEEIQ